MGWPELHGGFTHFPIVLLVVACVYELVAITFHKPALRSVSLTLLAGAVLTAIPALVAGWFSGQEMIGPGAALPPKLLLHRTSAFVSSGIAAVVLVWRLLSRDQLKSGALFLSVALLLASSAGVMLTGYLGGDILLNGLGSSPSAGSGVSGTPPRTGHPTGKAVVDPKQVAEGQKLYESNRCAGCHAINGAGGRMGPDLTHEAAKHNDFEWQIGHLKEPGKFVPGSGMPAYARLKPEELKALAAYMVSRE